MKITNQHNLPQVFVDAVTKDYYVRGTADFTATELVKPARISALQKKHEPDLVEDASDRVWSLSGDSRHVVLQRAGEQNPNRYIVEKRFKAPCPRPNSGVGYLISGQIDLYDKEDRTLYDWKETSVWKFILGDTYEWEAQGNVNRYLLQLNNIEVKAIKFIAILKDWKKRLARTTDRKDYPQCAVHVVSLPMWPVGQVQDWINKRAQAHLEARKEIEEGREPVLCTRSERWQRDEQFALMKRGRKRAIKLFSDEDQAKATVNWHTNHGNPGEKFYLEKRPAEPVRCLDFCPVTQFCSFGREALEKWRNAQ
jgi:hypothetical protein